MYAVSSPEMPPRPRRRVAPIAVTAAAAVVIVVAVVAYLVYAGRSVTVAGTITITENVIGGRTCLGMQDDDDLLKGAPVVIRAPSNQIVAVGELDEGIGGNPIDGQAQTCRFTFSVGGVPREKFYRVAVGRRSPAVFTYRQVAGRKITVRSRD